MEEQEQTAQESFNLSEKNQTKPPGLMQCHGPQRRGFAPRLFSGSFVWGDPQEQRPLHVRRLGTVPVLSKHKTMIFAVVKILINRNNLRKAAQP